MAISVIIIAKNEADNLQLSLPKLHWCDDIVLVNDNSTDNTVAIAEQFGCKIFNRAFDGFGTQKQFAVSKTSHQWILNIDADEVLSDELVQELLAIDFNNTSTVGYTIPIRHVFLGKVFLHGKESNFNHLRLFNKLSGNFDDAKVHEKVRLNGPIKALKNIVLHYSYKDLKHYFEKFNQYTNIGALKLKEKGKRRSLFLSVIGFPFYFIKHYFVYRNFMNGREGFIWSYLSAWYHVVKYLKLHELNSKK